MIHPTFKEFLKQTRQANVIPVYKEINADLDTPVSAYLKLKKNDYSFLLESVEGQEKIARYSFMGAEPSLIFTSKGKTIEITHPKKKLTNRFTTRTTPLDELRAIMRDFKAYRSKHLPRFYGGLVGYMGYDMVRFFEKIPDKNPDDNKFLDSVFMLTDSILIFDHVAHTIKIVRNVFLPQGNKKITFPDKKKLYAEALKKIESIHHDIRCPLKSLERARKSKKQKPMESNVTKSQFCEMVRSAKTYIKKGDIIQVVLSQRFKTRIHTAPFTIYRTLRSLNPSPYMFFLDLKDMSMLGASPEMLVRCEEGIVETRPIAGTRPRGRNEEEDTKLEKELLNDTKEKAEHVM